MRQLVSLEQIGLQNGLSPAKLVAVFLFVKAGIGCKNMNALEVLHGDAEYSTEYVR